MRDGKELQLLLDKLFDSVAPRRLLLTPKETSKLIGRAEQTLANDRAARRGLPYVKERGSVRYLLLDILAHIQSRRIDPEAGA
jgi:hypothetical protein